ncbi:hypothetical protein [Streptomyces griseoaurantiacus]|uniref:hypothetical protein n=1 Tax=Streptomyces griseoaurantiacus TaxID=68213 RepID=UPI0036BECF47
MTSTQPVAATGVDPDYEAYQSVVKLMSKGISDGILNALGELKDPAVFAQAVTNLANAQGASAAAVSDSTSLYNGFWTMANGVDTNLTWRSNAGVPLRSALIAQSIEPAQQPVSLSDGAHASGSFGVNVFGVGVGFSW